MSFPFAVCAPIHIIIHVITVFVRETHLLLTDILFEKRNIRVVERSDILFFNHIIFHCNQRGPYSNKTHLLSSPNAGLNYFQLQHF